MPLCCGLFFFLLTGKMILEDIDVQERNITGKKIPTETTYTYFWQLTTDL